MLFPSLSLPPVPKVRLLNGSVEDRVVKTNKLYERYALCASLTGGSGMECFENYVYNALRGQDVASAHCRGSRWSQKGLLWNFDFNQIRVSFSTYGSA